MNKPEARIAFAGRVAIAAILVVLVSGNEDVRAQRTFPEQPIGGVRPVYSVVAGSTEMEQRIYAALDEFSVLEFINVELSDVALTLSDRHRIVIALDQPALREVGIGPDTPVSVMMRHIKLHNALDRMLGQHGAAWIVRDDVLLITSKEAARLHPRTRMYYAADLMRKPPSADELYPKAFDAKPLIEVVRTCLRKYPDQIGISASEDTLIVSAPDQAHYEVQAVLYGLRLARWRLSTDPKWAFAKPVYLSEDYYGDRYKAIAAALEQKASAEFVQTPFSEVILKLSHWHEIPILLDPSALAEVGVSDDTPVTATIRGLSLRATLQFVLRNHQLSCMIADDALVITTPRQVEAHVIPAAYVVRDLADVADSHRQDYSRVLDLLAVHGLQSSPAENESRAATVFPLSDCVVIMQTAEGHRKIAELLATRREQPTFRRWSPATYAAEIEAYRTTPQRQTFIIKADSQEAAPDAIRDKIADFLEAQLPAATKERANLRMSDSQFFLDLTPLESAELQRKLLDAKIDAYNPRHFSQHDDTALSQGEADNSEQAAEEH